MRAFNVVHFRVKPGQEQSFIEHHRNLAHSFKGFLGGALVSTGDREYFLVGEWQSFDDIVGARPEMIASLDAVRDMLEDLGPGLGVTDYASGEVTAAIAPTVTPAVVRKAARVRKKAVRKAKRKVKKKVRKVRKVARKVRRVTRKVGRKVARKKAKASRKKAKASRKKARRS